MLKRGTPEFLRSDNDTEFTAAPLRGGLKRSLSPVSDAL